MQKIFYCEPAYGGIDVSFAKINEFLVKGYKVVSITPQHCAVSNGGNTSQGTKMAGGFVVVIEKSDEELTPQPILKKVEEPKKVVKRIVKKVVSKKEE